MELFNKNKAQNLSVDEFKDAFKKCWAEVQGNFFKYEALQTYQEPHNPAWVAFTKGDWSKCRQEIYNYISSYPIYKQALQNNVSFTRIRKVIMPLSDYLHFEFESYKVSSYFGERIGIIANELKSQIKELDYFPDFILFDNQRLFVVDYDESGILQECWLITDKEDVSKFVDFSDKITKKAIPFGEYLKTLPDNIFNVLN